MKTVLCVPGHDEKKVAKCREYGADLILFDLEDSVPNDKKQRAREIVASALRDGDAVRLNKRHGDDLEMVRSTGVRPHSLWLPKFGRWPILDSYVTRGAVAGDSHYNLVVIVETPQLLARLFQLFADLRYGGIIRAGLVGLAFGRADMTAEMAVRDNSPQLAYARQQIALAAMVAGVDAFDSPCTTFRAEATLIEAERACDLGYQWKGVIHPRQISITRDVRGSLNERGLSDGQLVDQYDAQPEAVIRIGDQIVAPPMIRAARRRLGRK